MKKNAFLAKTFFGLEPILAQELSDLGASHIEPVKRAVHFEGDQAMMYRANLWLRTAIRILKPIDFFDAYHEEALYEEVRSIRWDTYLGVNQTFAIDSVVKSSVFTHSHFAALKVKDAIVDQFRQSQGRRPSIDTDRPDIRIHLHINDTQVKLYLDSSGDSLHRRGYRLHGQKAPLNEVLAAGLILLSGWDGETPLVDPMCGSGTIPIEAAMIAKDRAPGLDRDYFGFPQWPDYDKSLWLSIYEEAREREKPLSVPIWARDISAQNIRAARDNVRRAGIREGITLEPGNFLEMPAPDSPGLLIANPPYGVRIGDEDVGPLYKSIGDRLKQAYAGFEAWILSANKSALKQVGLRPSRKMEVYNGPLACKYHQYELYAGSKTT